MTKRQKRAIRNAILSKGKKAGKTKKGSKRTLNPSRDCLRIFPRKNQHEEKKEKSTILEERKAEAGVLVTDLSGGRKTLRKGVKWNLARKRKENIKTEAAVRL